MYYSFFGAHAHSITVPDERVPLIIWLQGGPGASSQFGAFTELGPIRITKDRTSQLPNAWNIMGHTIFIDQPLTVGFSYVTDKTKPLVSNAEQAGDHLLNFLYNLYKQWPALKKSPLYITGESFAGHYLPAFGNKILYNNTFMKDTGIVFEGVAIGDGWTDPYNQINFYDSYLYSVGVVSNKFRDTCTWFQTRAIQHIDFRDYKNVNWL
jgi:carboxypeptidase C (cathepsin A)